MPKNNSFGFTLIELMVVVAIIGILATVGYSTYSSIQANARDAKKKADVDAIAHTLEDKYDAVTGNYPDYPSGLNDKDFTTGVIPKNGTQNYSFNLSPDKKAFVICVNSLEKSTQPYCKYSANGSSASVASLSSTGSVQLWVNWFILSNGWISFNKPQVINTITIEKGNNTPAGVWAVCNYWNAGSESYKPKGSYVVDNGSSNVILSNLNLSANTTYYLHWCAGNRQNLAVTYCHQLSPCDGTGSTQYQFAKVTGVF